jgi:lipopolysaccharide transport system permease protein
MEKFVTNIHPPKGFTLGLRELWQYRELFYFFTWRDIKVKYKQTYLGILWALLQPVGMMIIFTFLFSKTWPINTEPVKYPVFVLSGLILWNFFSSAVSHSAESMIQNANIIKKIYFPRLIIPGSATLVALFDFFIAASVFIVIAIVYRQPIHWSAILCFPAGLAMILLTSLGLGSFLAALNVKYRDFRYVVPFLLQVLFFASQIIYPLASIKEKWLQILLACNPVNGALEVFKYPLTGKMDSTVILCSLVSCMIFFVIGIIYFRKTEAYFADIA